MAGKNPWKVAEGLSAAQIVSAQESVAKLPLPVGKASTLQQLSTDFVFFSPAALYLRELIGGDQPWVDFCREFGLDIPFFHHRFNRPLFRHLNARDGDPAWNHVLWAVPKYAWQAFKVYVGSLTFIKDNLKHIDVVIVQELSIADPLARDLGVLNDHLPNMPVYFFGLTGTTVTCAAARVINTEVARRLGRAKQER
jgi:hypothetical protein